MSWKILLATAALLAGATLLVPAAGAQDDCTPAVDRTAQPIPGGTTTYYLRSLSGPGYEFLQLWQETNGDAGLQYGPTMSCSGKADRYVKGVCLGICPIPF